MNLLPGQRQIPTTRRAPRPGVASLLLVAAGLSLALAPGIALAAERGKERARVEFDKAQIQYKVGHFQEALDGYSRAYELFPAPAFLFNIGQCHKNLKNYERAIFFFEGYLREEKNPAKRTLAEELLAESKTAQENVAAKRAEKQAEPAPRAAIEPAPPPAARPPEAVPSPSPLSGAPPAAAAPVLVGASGQGAAAPPARSGPRWWVWAVLGGVVAAAAGGYLYWSSGGTTVDPPSGSLGTLDRRAP